MEFGNWVVVDDGFKCSWLLAEVAATIVGRTLYAGLSMMANVSKVVHCTYLQGLFKEMYGLAEVEIDVVVVVVEQHSASSQGQVWVGIETCDWLAFCLPSMKSFEAIVMLVFETSFSNTHECPIPCSRLLLGHSVVQLLACARHRSSETRDVLCSRHVENHRPRFLVESLYWLGASS